VRERRKLPPNHLLRQARLRTPSPSGSGRPTSRQELADAVNAYLAGKDEREANLDANHIGKLERGDHRWPNDLRREAFRHVLKVATDGELGFYIIRGLRSESVATAEEWSSDPAAATGAPADPADGAVDRRPQLRRSLRKAAPGAGVRVTPRALLWQAAHASAALSATAEAKRLGPTTLDHARDDLRRLTTDYVVTSDLPQILVEALLLRDRLAGLIDQSDARELHVMMGATCLLLASISHDAGESEAGMMQARSAETFADLARHPELLGWVLCTKAMIDLWRHRPAEVLAHAGRGEAIALSGSAGLRLKGLHVRALAQLNRKAEAAALMRHIEHAPSATSRSGSMADYGSLFSFPDTRQLYYAAVSHAHLGDYAAVEQCVEAVGHDDQPPVSGTWPVSWALSRSYLALARLDHKGTTGGPEAAAQALTPVLSLPEVQRINQLGQVLTDIDRRLKATAFRNSPSAKALREAIGEFRRSTTPAITAS